MALKLNVEKIDEVPESLRGEYTEKDGKWHLSVDGLEDTAGLKAQRDALLNEKKEAQRKAKEAEEAARLAAEEAARKSGSLVDLEKSLNEKFGAEISKRDAEISKRDAMILGSKKDAILAELSGKFISQSGAKLMLSNLVDVGYGQDGNVSVTFKGIDGKVVTTDSGEFFKHLSSIEDFKPLIKGSAASGGGASGGGASGGKNVVSKETFDTFNPSQKFEYMKTVGKFA